MLVVAAKIIKFSTKISASQESLRHIEKFVTAPNRVQPPKSKQCGRRFQDRLMMPRRSNHQRLSGHALQKGASKACLKR